jgi:hypothetical protein
VPLSPFRPGRGPARFGTNGPRVPSPGGNGDEGRADDASLVVRRGQPTVAGSRIGAGMTTTGQTALRMQASLTEPSTVCRTRLWP